MWSWWTPPYSGTASPPFSFRKYFVRTRESVILNYGSGSGSYQDIFVAIEKDLLSETIRPLNIILMGRVAKQGDGWLI